MSSSANPTVTPTPSSSTATDNAATAPNDDDDAIMVGIYGGCVLQEASNITDIRNSGFTTLICWSVHINEEGHLIYNQGHPIACGGAYTGPKSWPGDLADAFSPPTTLTRLVFSIGSWGSNDFRNIRLLMQKHGLSPENPLYANFNALKRAIPQIQTIDFDMEDDFDEQAVVSFAQLLYTIGFDVTFCPYHRLGFWEGALRKLYAINPAIVTAYNLQCYAGGARNASYAAIDQWILSVQRATGLNRARAAAFVRPGFFCKHRHQHETPGLLPVEIMSTLLEWRSLNLKGAWLWIYDDVLKNKGIVPDTDTSTDAYATSILTGLI